MPAAIKHLATLSKLDVSAILARWPDDDRYYAVQILQCDKKNRKCQVKFEDGIVCWLVAREIHLQFSPDRLPESNIVCCVCDGAKSSLPNEIIMCDSCEQGYHIECHEPKIDRDHAKLNDEESEWFCTTCDKIADAARSEQPTINERSIEKPPPSARKNASKLQTQSAKKAPRGTPKSKSKVNRVATPQAPKPRIRVSLRADLKKKLTEKVTSNPKPTNDTSQEKAEPILEEQMDIEETTLLENNSQGGVHPNYTPERSSLKEDKAKNEKDVERDSENNPDEVQSYSPASESLQGGAKVEEMPLIVIEAARKLAEQEVSIGTKEFADLIADVGAEEKEPESCTAPQLAIENGKSTKPTRTRKPSRKAIDSSRHDAQMKGDTAAAY